MREEFKRPLIYLTLIAAGALVIWGKDLIAFLSKWIAKRPKRSRESYEEMLAAVTPRCIGKATFAAEDFSPSGMEGIFKGKVKFEGKIFEAASHNPGLKEGDVVKIVGVKDSALVVSILF